MAIVALASFGIKQAEIVKYAHKLGVDPSKTCTYSLCKNPDRRIHFSRAVRLRVVGIGIHHHCGVRVARLQHSAIVCPS